MNVLRLIEIRSESQRLCARADKAHGRKGGFLHHVSQIAGQLQLAGAVNHVDLDLERRATDGCPRKARDKADLIGRDVRLRQEFADAEEILKIAAGDGNALGRLVGDEAHGALAAERGDLPFETAHAGLARVAGNDLADRVVGDTYLRALHAVLFQLLRQQMALGNLQFLLVRIGSQLNDLHPVEQRAGDGVGRVGGGDEHAVRQIERHLDIVVAEAGILGGVQNLQQRRRRVALVIAAELVDLVEQQQRVFALGLNERRHDAARHGADIRLAVAADFCLVAHTAERQAGQLPVQRPCNRNCDGRFAHARRADQAEDLSRQLRGQLAHGQRFENALFDRLKAEVVLVEDFRGGLHVQPLFRFLIPRQIEHGIEIVAQDGGLGGAGLLARKARHFAQQLFFRLLRELQRLNFRAVGIRVAVVVLAELLADDVQLLAQIIIALVLVDVLLHLIVDLAFQPQDIQLLRHHADAKLQPVDGGQRLEHALLVLIAERRVLRDEIGQLARVVGRGALQ